MTVYWLIPAQDALQNSLGKGNLQPDAYQARLDELSGLLRETFPDAQAVMVVDCLHGYSADSGRQVLRVEAVEQGVSRARIVKVGPPEKLKQELDGWHRCRRPANDRGRVLMELIPGARASDGSYRTLIYEDAQQTLRAAELRMLEEAFLGCVRWGQPSAESLELILEQVFAELASLLYARSSPAALCGPSADPKLTGRLQDALDKGLASWRCAGTLVEQCRKVALPLLSCDSMEVFDPVDYLPRLFAAGKHLPEVLRGPAHGDLHGRNVLVGIVEDEALFPAVFDYEDMGCDRLPGWDFAKLETELKVRALQEAFVGDEAEFVHAVCRFERRLAEQTEACNNQPRWPRPTAPETPAERLAYVLLALRRQAKRCLETLQGRSRSWLHEHYFLLSVYGVYAGKFGSYHRRDAIAAFVCSGFAAARFAWEKSTAASQQQHAREQAAKALADGDPTLRPSPSALSHHAALAFGREWARCRQQPFVEGAVQILEELRDEYPYVVEIGQELALALMELSNLTGDRSIARRAETLLFTLDEQCAIVSMETLCRWGRLWKDRGDQLFGSEVKADREMAHRDYQIAREKYQQAYEQCGNNYYPGINAATLLLLLGNAAEAARLAQSIIDDLDDGRRYRGNELAWVWATLGEAHLILGHCNQAAEYYRRAVAHPACHPHHVEAMHAQVQRILRVQPCESVDFDEM